VSLPSRIGSAQFDMVMPAFRSRTARAFVDELLAGFTTQAVTQKLSEADDSQVVREFRQVMENIGDSSPRVSGKHHETCTPMKPEAPQLQPTIQRMAYAKIPEQPAKPVDSQTIQEADALINDAQRTVSLSESRALSLQTELLIAFTAPGFQKKLHVLVRLHKDSGATDAEYHLSLRKLVRTEQIPIIVKYGFKPSEEGVIDMLQDMEHFKDHHGIYVNSEAIKEALFSPSIPAPSLVTQEVEIFDKPTSKVEVLDLLCNLHKGYSQPQFQAALENLKYFATDSRYEAGGYYHLPGRADLARQIQVDVLPLWSFGTSNEAMNEMISLCANYLMDPEVAIQFDAINSKLGMTPTACQRFRKLAVGLAETKRC